MKTIRSYRNVAEAGFAESLLQADGIDASLVDENAAAIGLEIRLQVPEEDVERALAILDGRAGLNSQPADVPVDQSNPAEREVEAPVRRESKSRVITCPNCGTEWELTAAEAEKSEFICQECNSTISINPDLEDAGLRASRVIYAFAAVIGIIAVLGIAGYIIREFFPHNAYVYYSRGISKKQNGNLDGAMADFNNAIALDPEYGAAYCARGITKDIKGDINGAMADYNQAVAFSPNQPAPYYDRAIEERKKGNLSEALADCNRAIALNQKPQYYSERGVIEREQGDLDKAMADDDYAITLDPQRPSSYLTRGFGKGIVGDLNGAISDDNHAIAVDPKYSRAYNSRGNTYSLMRNWPAALADYRKCCDLSLADQDYPRLYIYLIRARLGEKEAAAKELSTYIATRKNPSSDSAAWVATIAGYLLGNVTDANLFAAAGSPIASKEEGRTCEARYYAGMKRLLEGNKNGAIENLQKCVATGQKDYVEYGFARSELDALAR